MSRKLSIAIFVHAIRSDWNNGNAHFFRGLARALGSGPPAATSGPALTYQEHRVTLCEPCINWSTQNLETEANGAASLCQFEDVYSDLNVFRYDIDMIQLRAHLAESDIVIVHEWNTPELIEEILSLRNQLGFRALFYDTHHRASSKPATIRLLQINRFDGVVAFGEALRRIYQDSFGVKQTWTMQEAADTSVFYPRERKKESDVVWVGNWGDDERSREIREFLVYPAAELAQKRFVIHGVRYPQVALDELSVTGIRFKGYLPNLDVPEAYAAASLTVHIPRQHYAGSMKGIPTIRVFEALASGIPLISAPWEDAECLFKQGDFLLARTSSEMIDLIEYVLSNPAAAIEQADRGLATILAHHTCAHRALELTDICEEVLS